MPKTYWTMLIGTLAIAGIPGLAGFFSKDEILANVFHSHNVPKLVYIVGITTAFMTAFYMWRLMKLTFYGELRNTHVHPHESPGSMTLPLIALAIGSIAAGWPAHQFEQWLSPVFPHHEAHEAAPLVHWTLIGAAIAVAIAGIALAMRYELRGGWTKVLANKWYLDEIYDFLFVNGLAKGGGSALSRFDARVVDGGVNGTAWVTRFTSTASGVWDYWIVDGSVRLTGFVIKAFSYPVRIMQTGYVQTYALYVVAGLIFMIGVYVTR
jgi:NADH-quinone oxidoreductase subunit L